MRRIVDCGMSDYYIYTQHHINGTIFGVKKVIERKLCILIFSATCICKQLILRIIHQDIQNIYVLIFMRWAWHVARTGGERGVYRILVRKPEGKNHWGDLGVDGWIILGWISRRWDVGIWTGLGWPRIETGGGRL